MDGIFGMHDGVANVRREYREVGGRKLFKIFVAPGCLSNGPGGPGAGQEFSCASVRSRSNLRLLRPDEEAPSLRHIDFLRLRGRGIRVLLLDLDTLCLWRERGVPPSTAALLRRLQGQGFRLAVLTNARLPGDSPARRALAELGIPLFERARKPLPCAFRRALRRLGGPARRGRGDRRPAPHRRFGREARGGLHRACAPPFP
ncbi:MAG: HAD family hydrolase [Candidatus Bipolaricaulaceae bacterium]